VIRDVGALPRVGVPPLRNCLHLMTSHPRLRFTVAHAPGTVQPPYHDEWGHRWRRTQGNLCCLTGISSSGFAVSRSDVPVTRLRVRNRTPYPVSEQPRSALEDRRSPRIADLVAGSRSANWYSIPRF